MLVLADKTGSLHKCRHVFFFPPSTSNYEEGWQLQRMMEVPAVVGGGHGYLLDRPWLSASLCLRWDDADVGAEVMIFGKCNEM